MAESKPAAYDAVAARAFVAAAERVKPHTKLIALLALGADRWGVPAALWISAMMPLVAFVPPRFLPPPREAIA